MAGESLSHAYINGEYFRSEFGLMIKWFNQLNPAAYNLFLAMVIQSTLMSEVFVKQKLAR